ncbi:MAG: hypothetical protein ACE5OP_14155 [Candidatus Glassbacteria bacterium]
MAYKILSEDFWTDPEVQQLKPEERYLFLYLITNPNSHFSGIYYLPIPFMVSETGLSERALRGGLEALSRGGFCEI